jgi:hypothetical protein
VCAPPLLLTMTPGATSSVEDVAPDVGAVPVAVVPVPVVVDPALVDVASTPVVAVDDSPDDGVLDVESAVVDEAADCEDVPVVSAAATP